MPSGTPSGTAHDSTAPPRFRTRPLSRDRGGDARSVALAESMEAHQRAISVHQGAMVAEIAEFARTEAFRGDGALSMAAWLSDRCQVSDAAARTLVRHRREIGWAPPARRSASCRTPHPRCARPAARRRHAAERRRVGPGGGALERAPGQRAGPLGARDERRGRRQEVHRALRPLRRCRAAPCGPSSPPTPTPWSSPPWWPGPRATTTPRPPMPTTSPSRPAWPTPWSRSAPSGDAETAGRAGAVAAVAGLAVGGAVGGDGDPDPGWGRPLFGGAPAHIVVHADLSFFQGGAEGTGAEETGAEGS